MRLRGWLHAPHAVAFWGRLTVVLLLSSLQCASAVGVPGGTIITDFPFETNFIQVGTPNCFQLFPNDTDTLSAPGPAFSYTPPDGFVAPTGENAEVVVPVSAFAINGVPCRSADPASQTSTLSFPRSAAPPTDGTPYATLVGSLISADRLPFSNVSFTRGFPSEDGVVCGGTAAAEQDADGGAGVIGTPEATLREVLIMISSVDFTLPTPDARQVLRVEMGIMAGFINAASALDTGVVPEVGTVPADLVCSIRGPSVEPLPWFTADGRFLQPGEEEDPDKGVGAAGEGSAAAGGEVGSSELSGAGIAGIVVGIVAIMLAITVIVTGAFCWRKRAAGGSVAVDGTDAMLGGDGLDGAVLDADGRVIGLAEDGLVQDSDVVVGPDGTVYKPVLNQMDTNSDTLIAADSPGNMTDGVIALDGGMSLNGGVIPPVVIETDGDLPSGHMGGIVNNGGAVMDSTGTVPVETAQEGEGTPNPAAVRIAM